VISRTIIYGKDGSGLNTSIAIIAAGGAALVGLVIVAAAFASQARAMRRLVQVADDLRAILQAMQENRADVEERRLAVEKHSLDLAVQDRQPGVAVRTRGTLTLLEDSQEFKLAYFVIALGDRRVLADRVRAVLINDRDPELKVTLAAAQSVVLEPGKPYDAEVIVTVRDLARVNLPYVPEFKFLRESCRLEISVEYEGADGDEVRIERDLLER